MSDSSLSFIAPPETPETTPESGDAQPSKGAPTATESLEELVADLDEERQKAILGAVKKARQDTARYRTQIKELEPLAALGKTAQATLDAQKTAEQRSLEQADSWQKKATEAAQRAVRSEVRALAAEAFADPDDAVKFLDVAAFVDANGDLDAQGLKTELTNLLNDKPYLAKAAPGERRPPRPDASQASGSRGSAKGEPRDQFADLMHRTMRS